MTATIESVSRTDGGQLHSLIRCESGSGILEHVEDPPWTTDATPTDITWVTAEQTAAAVSAQLGSNGSGQMPASVDVISLGSSTIPVRGGSITVQTLPPEANLGRVTEAIFERVQSTESAGHDVVVVIDDLAAITDGYPPTAIFRFLHLLTAKGRARNWTVRVGIDDSSVSDRVFAGLELLFDDID